MNGRIERRGQPLSPLQMAVLGGVTETPSQPRDITARCGVSRERVRGALLVLQGKDLAQKTSDGWRLA